MTSTPVAEVYMYPWNSAQCYVAAWKGGEFGGEWIHAHVWLNPFAVRLKLSQHCSSAIPQNRVSFKKVYVYRNGELYQLNTSGLVRS